MTGKNIDRQLKLPFGPLRNSNLFSNHWLENRLSLEPEWEECWTHATHLLGQLGQLWKQQKNRVAQYVEPTLEEAFIQPVLKQLGWTLLYQTFLRGRKPDYALFLCDADLETALTKGRKDPAFWDYAALVADAKAWPVNLDRPSIVNEQREYPPEQIEWYIAHSNRTYGILTNGRVWRLYPRELSSNQPRFNTYFECDLATLLERWTTAGGDKKQRTLYEDKEIVEDFLTFYLLFSPAGFVTIETRKPLVQRAIEGSNEYRLGIGEGLKERVFEALRICTKGFLSHKPNNLEPENHIGVCKEQSLVLLYRLLFIMYAEDRELLPFRSNRVYRDNRSLSRFRDQIATKLDNAEHRAQPPFEESRQEFWDDLSSLFDLIDRGAKRYGVPAYNGGLFDPEQNIFLRDMVLPDNYLVRVIDQLSRAPDIDHPNAGLFRVDYRDLSLQHLGYVYEGLLELQPHWAKERMVVIRNKNHQRTVEKVIPASQALPDGFEVTSTRYEPGEVFLVTDKGERRATGSYYTPDHIVDYIVSQTLGKLCKESNEQLEAEIKQAESERKNTRGQNRQLLDEKLQKLYKDFDDRVLQFKILDPAMGSGHFLLRACQYLAEEIATNPHTNNPETNQLRGDESLLTFWKRRVVEHCLYGVDINPLAVELAKLALWLETAAIGQPLTFLDHHLRCGNSLVGGWVKNLGSLPNIEPLPLFEQEASSLLPGVLEGLKLIADKSSDSLDDVKLKGSIYHQTIDKVRKPFVSVADLWCATFFLDKSNQITPDQYYQSLQSLRSPADFRKLLNVSWFKAAIDTAHRSEVSCFHWELEFPDIYFDLTGRRPEAGFDAVIGNPPYDVLSEKETGRDLTALNNFLKSQAIYLPSFRGKNNLYKLFVCLAVGLVRERGRVGFITPMAILGDDQAAEIRKMLLSNGAFTSIDAFPQKDDLRRRVFPEAKLATAVFTYEKNSNGTLTTQPFTARVHPAQYIEPNSPFLTLSSQQIPLYDPTNFTIVSCSQADWEIAVRIISSGRLDRLGDYVEFFQGEINETNEKAKGTVVTNQNAGPLILRASAVCLYAIREPSQEKTGKLYLDVQKFLKGKTETSKAFYYRKPRVGVQGNAPQNNFRRLIAAPIEPGTFCFYTINFAPESQSKYSLDFLLALLNSKLCEWYFRLGSTNAHANQYSLRILPCPKFAETETTPDKKLNQAANAALKSNDLDAVFQILQQGIKTPPFSPAIRDIIGVLVGHIINLERGRGEISRADRSALSPKAQHYQDLIDRLFYAMAGLTDDEAKGLEERLAKML